MTSTQATSVTEPARRVRQHVRDGAAVIVFSAAASTGVALAIVLLARVAG
jgi:hypothetical protein